MYSCRDTKQGAFELRILRIMGVDGYIDRRITSSYKEPRKAKACVDEGMTQACQCASHAQTASLYQIRSRKVERTVNLVDEFQRSRAVEDWHS